MSKRGSVRSSASVAPAAFTIEEYKRKQKVLAASKKPRRRTTNSSSKASPGSTAAPTKLSSAATISSLAASKAIAEPTYSKTQKQYLDFCVEKLVDPDMKLLSAIRECGFLLKLDSFGADELNAHMEFLPRVASYKQICLSLGSVDIKRDLRNKFERLGIKRGVAFTEEGASSVIKSVSLAAYKTKHLLRLEIVGIRSPSSLAPMLAKAITSCTKLEFVSFAQTRLGDAGIEAIAMALGKCAHLQQLSLAGCQLTDKARDHVSKIISLHGVLKDETVWSSSLRGETVSVANARPSLLLDLSQNALGDDAAEAICNALFHDKWLLGLNLSQNRISRVGISLLADTLAQSNRTLAVIQVSSMKEPVDQASLHRLETLMRDRRAFLQQLAFETREKRLLLCSVLLEWDVNRELVLEICQSGERDASLKSRSFVSESRSAASSVSGSSSIKLLTERMSAMEDEHRKTRAYMNKLEEENQRLRGQLKMIEASGGGMSNVEERIIARLEDTISALALQVGDLALENSAATPAAADHQAVEKESAPVSEQTQ
ncbi:hypothetical protein Gpo141_00000786 [Globisporangium polare]